MTTDIPDLKHAVHEGFAIESKRNPKLWPGLDGKPIDRLLAVSASEIAQCARRIKYSKHSLRSRTSLNELGSAERGHDAEAWVIRQLHNFYDPNDDWALELTGKNQRSVVKRPQSGTPDGLLSHCVTGTRFNLDIKSLDPRTNIDRLPRKSNVWQVTQNAYLLNEKVTSAVVGSIIFYVDASDYSKLYQFYVQYDPELAATLTRRAKMIMDAKSPEDLPAEGMHANPADYTASCTYCPYKAMCSDHINRGPVNEQDQMEKLLAAERAVSHVFRQS